MIKRMLKCDVCGLECNLGPFDNADETIKAWGWAIVPRHGQHICRSCILDLLKQKAK